MEIQRTVSQCVASYPVEFADAVETIQEAFPDLLSRIKEAVGESISVKLVVDLPIRKGSVLLSKLREKKISVEGLRGNTAGRVTIEALEKKNIVICEETAPATWKWSDKTIYVAHSSYGNEQVDDQEYYQILNILFEMHNASQTQHFKKLTRPKKGFTKLDFVRAFEGIEHDTVIRTRESLSMLTMSDKFIQEINIYRHIYDDAELHFMHQQLAGHSLRIAKRYDVFFFPHAKKEAFHGTWKTKFEEGNDLHQRIRENLYEILSEQLSAIADGDRSNLDAILKKVRIAVGSGQEWARLVMLNLNFFQEKYQEYVQNENPQVVVDILEARRVRATCHRVARENENTTSLFNSFLQLIRVA